VPIYVTLAKFTPQGLTALGSLRERWPKAQEAIERGGGRILASYGLIGQYDAIVISEWPSEREFVQGMGAHSEFGLASTLTCEAIELQDFGELLSRGHQLIVEH
jgi:uncharacterized protein with GYD domain